MNNHKELWKKLLGYPIKSFTDENKVYYVTPTEDFFECTCPDWKFRRGSRIVYYKEDGQVKSHSACKHIIKYMRLNDIEVLYVTTK